MPKRNRALLSLAVMMAIAALAGCVDEGVVFEDRGIYDRIPDEAQGFIGYADPSDNNKLTVCGYCHSDLQAQWEGTAHAMAWEGLQTSDHAQAFCEACHTVNSLGNVAMEDSTGGAVGGHVAVPDEDGRYHDVQCESCHGPGLTHASDPGVANRPLAPVNVGPDLTYGCGQCHTGEHHPFVEEWAKSPHGNVTAAAALDSEGGCTSCHTGEGALARLGVTSDYLEKGQLAGADYMQITCAVCHDPHSAQHEGQLRFPIVVTNVQDHLCAQCHDRRAQPDVQGNQDWLQPHSPETALLAGTAGWFPAGGGLTPGSVTGPHGVSNNDHLCASCHVVPYTNTTEDGTFTSAGHGFRAAPCVDQNGLPSGETGCALTTAARSFAGCAECHGSADDAAAALNTEVDVVLGYANTLSGYLDQLGSEINANDGRFTVAEGALFNFTLATSRTSFRPNQSTEARRRALAATVTHNPAFIEQLLVETIAAVEAAYPAVAADAAGSQTRPAGN